MAHYYGAAKTHKSSNCTIHIEQELVDLKLTSVVLVNYNYN